ncbi:MAG: hypothetical protein MK078_05180 [Crocinitomicaceae bacterium]|nr:hypothetical protein [Crocinitomicaceae bacterium]
MKLARFIFSSILLFGITSIFSQTPQHINTQSEPVYLFESVWTFIFYVLLPAFLVGGFIVLTIRRNKILAKKKKEAEKAKKEEA